MGVARISDKAEGTVTNGDVFTNYDVFKLPYPDILRMDFTQPSLRRSEMFDAIICDPPYGIRAGSKKFGKRSKKEEKAGLTEEVYNHSNY